MAKPTRNFVQTETGQLHVRQAQPATASERPLLCLHMVPQSGRDFEKFMMLASRDRLVIAPDYPGYGESDPPPELGDISISTYARVIWEALVVLGVESVDIVGHHSGAKVAIEMARQKPEDVGAMVLISLSVMTAAEWDGEPRVFSPIIADDEGEGLRAWWATMRSVYDKNLSNEALMERFAETIRSGQNHHHGFQAAYDYNAQLAENLTNLSQHITLINPDDDLVDITPKAMGYIQNGILLNKSDWHHGFLSLHAEDAVQTVLTAIAGAKTSSQRSSIGKISA